jgi:predicted GIY-YIG superfamily endonuclease
MSMYFVYILKSTDYNQIYTGYTSNLRGRLVNHNNGSSRHTSKYKPWELVVCIGFRSKISALEFERYLKSGSGIAFARRHLLQDLRRH